MRKFLIGAELAIVALVVVAGCGKVPTMQDPAAKAALWQAGGEKLSAVERFKLLTFNEICYYTIPG